MAELQAYSCDAITGAVIDRIPVSAFSYNRLLSAGGSGSVTIPLGGTFTAAQLKALVTPWARLLVLERDGQVEFIGHSLGSSYSRGQNSVTVKLEDVWMLLNRRGAWNHTAPNMEQWQVTVIGNLAEIAAGHINRSRTGPALPAMGYPVTLPGGYAGPSVTRTYYGYNVETVSDVFADLLAEGLDVYFQPRWSGGAADWLFRAGNAWSSGVTREFFVTADESPVTSFSESSDAARVTNNARNIGEGSEVDMLVQSERNQLSPYPLLDRATIAKNVSDRVQLAAMSLQDLSTYGAPTVQWDFSVEADTPIDVGDMVRLYFHGDPWIGDGYYTRRVVKISGDMSNVKTVGVQQTGGS